MADSSAGDSNTLLTNSIDEQNARNDPHSNANKASVINVNDFNRDALVNTVDQQLTRAPNSNSNATAPKFLNIAAGGPFAPVTEMSPDAQPTAMLAASPSSPLDANEEPLFSNGLASSLTAGMDSPVRGLSVSLVAVATKSTEVAISPGHVAAIDLSAFANPSEPSNAGDDVYDVDEGLLDLHTRPR